MDNLRDHCRQAFAQSRKLREIVPNAEQLSNVEMRLKQIFTERELTQMDEKDFVRQVERVWPIAQYVDQKG